MPILQPVAPYDSLATVTQLARTVLADYIQGINPLVSGVVSTNGQTVTWVSGNPFTYLFAGATLTIGGSPYVVLSVSSSASLTLQASAGVQVNVAYSASLPTGDIFADSQAYVLPTINLAWRKLQKKLADKGHPRLQSEADILAVPATTNLDPASQQYLTWGGFFDGTTLQAAPTLPADFISPLRLWERPTGVTLTFSPVLPAGDALWSLNKSARNRYFDWRTDAIYIPGSTLIMDFRLRYSAFLPDIVAGGSFGTTPVPILRVAEALAYYAAEIFVIPRGGVALAPAYAEAGDEAIDQITNSWAKLQQRSSFHRKPWGGRGRRTYPGGW